MSSSSFKSLLDDILEDLTSSVEKTGSRPARKQLIRTKESPYNTYAINRAVQVKEMEQLFPGYGEAIVARMFSEYARIEALALSKFPGGSKEALNIKAAAQKAASKGETVFFCKGYDSVTATKGKNLVKWIKQNVLKKEKLNSEDIGSLRQVGKVFEAGHTQLPASQLRFLRAEQIADRGGISGIKKDELSLLKTIVYKTRTEMELTLAHEQVITSSGKLKKEYVPQLKSQLKKDNFSDSVQEKALIEAFQAQIQSLADAKGSPSLSEAVESTLLHTLKGKQGKVTKGKAKSKVSSKNKTKKKGKATTSHNLVKASGVSSSVLKIAKETKRRKGKKPKGASSSPLGIITQLNAKLPEALEDNMGAPALERDTGRFAKSVKVMDIQTTAKGFPSLGYTYDRDNYGQYEATSGSTQWASSERDPRALIDKSIRDIAAEMAIGRFFTRRL